jgi:methyltransferase (TIGR00027 family)
VREAAGGVADGQHDDGQNEEPDSTAVRVALWRAMHVQVDAPPHVLADEIGLRLAAPTDGWRDRPDMDADATRGFRAGIVATARFIEDLVAEQAGYSVQQYVILGAGLDTFAQREPGLASRLQVFELDRPGPQAWKRRRLASLGYGMPAWLHLVPSDFETGESWWQQLAEAGFDPIKPAVVASTGVTMYLTKAATLTMLRQLGRLAPGSTLAMTFQLPTELLDAADRPGREATVRGARSSGTPFISFYSPAEMLAAARGAGFADARHVPLAALGDRYFAGRPDGLRPPTGQDLLIAGT